MPGCVGVCMPGCVGVCMPGCVGVCMPGCVWMCLPGCVRMCIILVFSLCMSIFDDYLLSRVCVLATLKSVGQRPEEGTRDVPGGDDG